MNIFKPKEYVKSIFDIDYKLLKDKGIKLIIFDLDNTIILVNEAKPNKKVIKFLNDLARNFIIVIASNNNKKRVEEACEDIHCDYIYYACKPYKKMFNYLKKYSIEKKEICLIGDQLLTDIYCGNKNEAFTILVDPMSTKDLKVTYLNRFLEKRIKKRIKLVDGDYYGKSKIL